MWVLGAPVGAQWSQEAKTRAAIAAADARWHSCKRSLFSRHLRTSERVALFYAKVVVVAVPAWAGHWHVRRDVVAELRTWERKAPTSC